MLVFFYTKQSTPKKFCLKSRTLKQNSLSSLAITLDTNSEIFKKVITMQILLKVLTSIKIKVCYVKKKQEYNTGLEYIKNYKFVFK